MNVSTAMVTSVCGVPRVLAVAVHRRERITGAQEIDHPERVMPDTALETEEVLMSIAADDGTQAGPTVKNLGRRRAAGIYGAIITAAILDTAGGHVSTVVLVISVVVTLLVYWIAEEYAEVLGEHTAGGRLPSQIGRAHV